MTLKHIKTMSGDLISLEVSETETVTSFYEKVSKEFDVKRIQLQLFRMNEEDELKESDELLGGEEDEVFSALIDKMTYVVDVNHVTDQVFDLNDAMKRYEMYEVVLRRHGMEVVKQCLYVKPMYSPTDEVKYYLANREIPSRKMGDGPHQVRYILIKIARRVTMHRSFDDLMTSSPLGENLSDKRRIQLVSDIQTRWTELMMEVFNAYLDDDEYPEESQDSWS